MKQGNQFLLSTQERAVIEAMRGGAYISATFPDLENSAQCEAELEPFRYIGMKLYPTIMEDKRQSLGGQEFIQEVSADGKHSVRLGILSAYAFTKKPAAVAPATD